MKKQAAIKLTAALVLAIIVAALIHGALADNMPVPEPPTVAAYYPTVIARAPEVAATEPSIPDVPEQPKPAYTEEELEMLACVIYQEAGSSWCSDEMQIAVGNVVLDRVASPDWPGTIEAVLTQYRQFGEYYWTGIVWREDAELYPEAVERAYENAQRALEGERAVPEGTVWCAEFPQGTECVYEEGGVYFCR